MQPKSLKPNKSDAMEKAWLDTIQTLSQSVEAELVRSGTPSADAELRLRWRRHAPTEKFLVQATRTHLSYALASGFIEQARATAHNWVLFAPYVPGPIGRHLATHGVSYVDAVGNCHLETKVDGLIAHVEGKRPDRGVGARTGLRLPSYQLIFTILAEPELLHRPLRDIAAAAGIGKTAVGDQLNRLEQQGMIARTSKRSSILRRRELLDRWLSAYPDVVRPAWLHGRYRLQTDDPEAVERQASEVWGELRWALGGGAAAWRMDRFYRGNDTVIHVEAPASHELRQMRALPDPDGPLTILRTPGTAAYLGVQPHLAHPLLVYTEMITSPDPRMREAAERIRLEFPGGEG